MDHSKKNILELVYKYNTLMNEAINGPNCIDPFICHADCCHLMIDVPKLLAEYYIKRGYVKKEDFCRGDLFSFQINLNPSNSKCIFYDRDLNGCNIHNTMYKPPQCWIYPTGFSNDLGEGKKMAKDGSVACKVTSGWRIVDNVKIQTAKMLFDKYISFCTKEFEAETTVEMMKTRLEPIFNLLRNCSPKIIAGIEDGWDHFNILKSEGISLKLKSLCDQVTEDVCKCDYLECTNVCNEIIDLLRRDLLNDVVNFTKSHGPKPSYSFLELWNRTKVSRHNST